MIPSFPSIFASNQLSLTVWTSWKKSPFWNDNSLHDITIEKTKIYSYFKLWAYLELWAVKSNKAFAIGPGGGWKVKWSRINQQKNCSYKRIINPRLKGNHLFRCTHPLGYEPHRSQSHCTLGTWMVLDTLNRFTVPTFSFLAAAAAASAAVASFWASITAGMRWEGTPKFCRGKLTFLRFTHPSIVVRMG